MKVFSNPQGVNEATTYQGTEAPGYPASNTLNTAIRISWRTINTNPGNYGIKLVFAEASEIHAVIMTGMNEACSIPPNALDLGRSDVDFDKINDVPIIQDPYGRYKMAYYPYENGYTGANYDRIWFTIYPAVSVGPYFEIGAVYIFGAGLGVNTNTNPAYGSSVEHRQPVVTAELANGGLPAVVTGPSYDVLSLSYDAVRSGASKTNEPEYIWRALHAGDVGIDLETENYQFWPMRKQDYRMQTNFNTYNWDKVSFALREIVTI